MVNIDGCGTVLLLPYSKTSGDREGVARLGGRSPSLSQAQRQTGASSTRTINATRLPSSNYRWIDYNDMMREDEWRNPIGCHRYHERSNVNASDMATSPRFQSQRRRTPATTARSSRSSRSSRSYIHPPPRRHRNLGRRLSPLPTCSRRNNTWGRC